LEHIDDRQQDDGTQQCDQHGGNGEGTIDGPDVKDGAEEVASQERADNCDNDVEQQVRIVVHDHSCDPTNHCRNDEVYKNVHFYLLYECLQLTIKSRLHNNLLTLLINGGSFHSTKLLSRNLTFFGLMLRHAFIDLLFGILLGVSVFHLKQDNIFIELDGRFINPAQVKVVDQAPPFLGFSADLFPLAFKDSFVHFVNLLIFLNGIIS
jgi:hypothetical protein